MLDHPNQRFRFSYILGRTSGAVGSLDDVDDDDVDDDLEDVGPLAASLGIDLAETALVVDAAVSTLRNLVSEHEAEVRAALADDEADERVLEEIIEETLDEVLRGDERFHAVVDSLFDEIEKRFTLLAVGEIRRNRQGWPIVWSWSTEDRVDLVRAVTRFSSNYAPLFGSLLTPLVSGIRVAGPFGPTLGTRGVAPARDHRRRRSRSHAELRSCALHLGVQANRVRSNRPPSLLMRAGTLEGHPHLVAVRQLRRMPRWRRRQGRTARRRARRG